MDNAYVTAPVGFQKGLGAQKVRTNFTALETEAQQRDKNRETLVSLAAEQKVKDKADAETKLWESELFLWISLLYALVYDACLHSQTRLIECPICQAKLYN